MTVNLIRSDRVYAKMMAAPPEEKNELYRRELMAPFAKKWAAIHIPLYPASPGGYDVLSASAMLGHLPPARVDNACAGELEQLSSDALWDACAAAVRRSLACFEERGISLPVQEYLFTVLLAEGEHPAVRMNGGYCGDGGIPGYLLAWLTPSEATLRRLPAALAHEVNHNVRFQFIRWRPDISLGDMIVSEGLAERFAVELFGQEFAGPWVTETGPALLEKRIKPVIREHLGVRGLQNLNAYLYGDELAALTGCPPVGAPYCAGYACGYHLVGHYLEKTGKSVFDATLLPAEEILSASEDFWA